jgi:hypothetical protein
VLHGTFTSCDSHYNGSCTALIVMLAPLWCIRLLCHQTVCTNINCNLMLEFFFCRRASWNHVAHNTLLCFVYKTRSVYALLLTMLIKTSCYALSFAFVLIFSTQWLVRNEFSFLDEKLWDTLQYCHTKIARLANFFHVLFYFVYIQRDLQGKSLGFTVLYK